ncbi:hypothetical protein COOONC_10834 [Cooperia oncophora]
MANHGGATIRDPQKLQPLRKVVTYLLVRYQDGGPSVTGHEERYGSSYQADQCRYWSVTDISYVQNRTPKRIMIMLTVIWMTSLLISLAPFAGWKDDGFKDRVLRQHVCLISQQISYQVR